MRAHKKIYQFYERWLIKNKAYSANTKNSYLRIIRNFLIYLEASKILRLKEVDHEVIKHFSHYRTNKKRYAPAFITLRLAALKCFFDWAYQHRFSSTHPLIAYKKAKIILPTPVTKIRAKITLSRVILSLNEEEKIFNHKINTNFIEVRNKSLVLLILSTALFVEELITLPIEALNLRGSYIKVNTPTRGRSIPITNTHCQLACQAWLKLRKKLCMHSPSSSLFITEKGNPLSRRMVYKIVSEYMKAVDIQPKHSGAEVLRHTGMCNLLQRYPLEKVQAYSGLKTLAQLTKFKKFLEMRNK